MRLLPLFVVGAVLCSAAEKKPPVGQAGSECVEIDATLYPDKEALRRELGSDLGGHFLVVKVSIAPKGGGALAVSPDDFVLRSDKDGQRSGPLAPSQIAGRGALVISSRGGGGLMAENPGPVWGGYPGTGRPGRLGGESTVVGNAGESSAEGTVQSGSKEKENPLLATLKERALPNKTDTGPVSGLLYFLLEGKHKAKDLELLYNGPAGKLSMRFRP